jgi:LacI family transcriptional regulator, repressor for deo operon, udp, cdd, tsx, nupC, and nupG
LAQARLRDVAAHAGVSVKTVSNVVHGYARVSAATRSRVRRSIDELRYQPNVAARNLRTGRSTLVTLATPSLREPYFAELASAMIEVAAAHGLSMVVEQTSGELARERAVLYNRSIFPGDALVLSPLRLSAGDLARRPPGGPVVLLGEHLGPACSHHVGIDNVGAARLATEHLLSLGRTRVGAVGLQRRVVGPARLRLRGYREALKAAGASPRPAWEVPTSAFTRAEGYRAVAALLRSDVVLDALFCFNDSLAVGALAALRDAGRRVPDDVAVIGFDDVEEARYTAPRLSTIRVDSTVIATGVVELLGSLAEAEPRDASGNRHDGGGHPAYRDVRCECRVVVRESTLGAGAAPQPGLVDKGE